MFKIIKANTSHSKLLAKISKQAFLVPHGHSGPKEDIAKYVRKNFNEEAIFKELENTDNQYYLIYHKNEIAGFSVVIFNVPNENIASERVTKMSRLYLLKEFYGLGLGKELFDFNISLAKQNNQHGVWLAVWIENQKAINFYKKMGFTAVGKYDFQISETHFNPNHILYLKF